MTTHSPARTRFGGVRTPYITEQTQVLAASGDRIPDPDFGLSRDVDFWKKLDGNSTVRSSRSYRKHMIAAPAWTLEPPSSEDKPLVPYMEALVNKTRGLRTSLLGLADAVFRGTIPARLLGEFCKCDLLGKGTPMRWYTVLKIRVQNKGRWELKKWTEDGETFFDWAIWDWNVSEWRIPDNPEWYVHHTYAATETDFYGEDLARPLYFLTHAEHILREASLDTAERFGSPWILAQLANDLGGVTATGTDLTSYASKVTAVLNELKKMRAHNAMVADERVKIQLIEAPLNGARLIRELIDEIKHEIRILILGSNLPTSATQGGSFSLAQIQDESTRRLVSYDRHLLSETLTEQYVERLFRWNKPAFDRLVLPDGRRLSQLNPPRFVIQDEEILTPEERRQTLEIAEKGKLKVRRKDLYKLANLTPPDEEDTDVVELGGATGLGFHSPVWAQYAEATETR